jgi:hypothetical protein
MAPSAEVAAAPPTAAAAAAAAATACRLSPGRHQGSQQVLQYLGLSQLPRGEQAAARLQHPPLHMNRLLCHAVLCCAVQIPSNIIMLQVGVPRWLGFLVFSWGEPC